MNETRLRDAISNMQKINEKSYNLLIFLQNRLEGSNYILDYQYIWYVSEETAVKSGEFREIIEKYLSLIIRTHILKKFIVKDDGGEFILKVKPNALSHNFKFFVANWLFCVLLSLLEPSTKHRFIISFFYLT